MGLRELDLNDAGAIENVRYSRALKLSAAAEERLFKLSDFTAIDWRDFFSRSGHRAWGAFDEEALVGTLFLQPDSRHPNHVLIKGLWVAESHRGQGLGQQLLSDAVSYADAECYRMVKLWVAENNHSAMSLYRDLNFKPTGRMRAAAYDPFHHMQQYVLDLRQEPVLPV